MSLKNMVYGNGVLAEKGIPTTEIDEEELFELIRAEFCHPSERDKYLMELQRTGLNKKPLGVPPNFNPDKLSSVGWGIIWAPEPLTATEEAVKQALTDLIEYRAQQMCELQPRHFHYRENWDFDDFLYDEGRRIEPGDMNPAVVPYYICIVGSPERIPWEFQQYLDSEYAVGRLWFDDPEDCKKYVRHLLSYESAVEAPRTSRDVLFVGTRHEGDRSTENSAARLVEPLYDWLSKGQEFKFNTSLLSGERSEGGAYKTQLLERLKRDDGTGARQVRPSLLFTAGHGLEFEKGSPEQTARQGALICQEWPGWFVPPQPDQFLAADDINEGVDLRGMIAFCFACFSAGTPQKEDWVRPTLFRKPKQIANEPFMARLPQKMLANGLLAFVGHVSKAWESSFLGLQGNSQHLGGFYATIGELLRGRPVGHATDYMNQRWVRMNLQLDKWMARNDKSKEEIITLWQARNDIRGYAVLGDPATRLKVEHLQ